MIVVDTNVLAYLFLPGPMSDSARALLQHDPDWAAPVLWRSEFRNVLAGYLRRGLLSLDQARAVADAAQELMAEGEFEVPSADVLARVVASGCSAYDCEFVVLADRLGIRMYTADTQLLDAFPGLTTRLPPA